MTNEARVRANQIARALDTINGKLANLEKDIPPKEVSVAGDIRTIVTYADEDLAGAVKTLIKLALLRDKAKYEAEMEAL